MEAFEASGQLEAFAAPVSPTQSAAIRLRTFSKLQHQPPSLRRRRAVQQVAK